MSSKATKDLDELMLMVDSMESPKKKEEEKPKEEPKQELDKEKDEPSSEDDAMDSEQIPEPAPEELEAPIEEPLGLNTDKIDYPEETPEEEEMDVEAGKLPELRDIRDGGEGEEYGDEVESPEPNDKKDNEKIKSLKQNSTSGMIEFVSTSFAEENPEHSVCCVMSDKVISLRGKEAYETLYSMDDDLAKFHQPIRNRELEEQKETNNAIIAKLLNFDNI